MTVTRPHSAIGNENDCRSRGHEYDTILSLRFYPENQWSFSFFSDSRRVGVSYKLKYVIPGEEVALQHQLLVCDMMIDMPPQIKRKFTPHPKMWKLRDPQTCSRFQEVFKAHVPAVETEAATSTEEIWVKLKADFLKTTEEVCGTTKPHRWRNLVVE